jgi:hypothetical protein
LFRELNLKDLMKKDVILQPLKQALLAQYFNQEDLFILVIDFQDFQALIRKPF